MITPKEFAVICAAIVAEKRGHEAHRDLDLLTNEVLREQGFGKGIDIFEKVVAGWHRDQHSYPHVGPCPDCEMPANG